MNQKYSINDILESVSIINPEKISTKKFSKEEILSAIQDLNETRSQLSPKEELNKKNYELKAINKTSSAQLPVEKDAIKEKIYPKIVVEKKEKTYTQPLMLTNIIKYEPAKSKALFLKKLHNSHLKIIAMKTHGAGNR
jgi:hypothetical protein